MIFLHAVACTFRTSSELEMIVKFLIISVTVSFNVMTTYSGDNEKIEIDKKLVDESLEHPIKINLLSLKNSISGYIKWHENDPPINITIQVEFKTDRISNKDVIAIDWVMENQTIDNNFKLSENISFPCHKFVEFDKDDPHRGSAKLNVFNIESPFIQRISVRAYQKQKFNDQQFNEINGTTQYEVEEIEDEIRVTKVYKKVQLRYKRKTVLLGELFVLDISKVLMKTPGKVEIDNCYLSYVETIFNMIVSPDIMYLNETSQTLEINTRSLHLNDVALKCEVIINRVNKIPFEVEFGVRNLVLQIENDFIRYAISKYRPRQVLSSDSVNDIKNLGESSFVNLTIALANDILKCTADNDSERFTALKAINETVKEEYSTIKLCEDGIEFISKEHKQIRNCSGNDLFVRAKDICSKIQNKHFDSFISMICICTYIAYISI